MSPNYQWRPSELGFVAVLIVMGLILTGIGLVDAWSSWRYVTSGQSTSGKVTNEKSQGATLLDARRPVWCGRRRYRLH
jgi:hypothetical protein